MNHGQRFTYVSGCHCQPCTTANRRYEKGRQLAALTATTAPTTDAVRRHVRTLIRRGVGIRQIAAQASVSRFTVQQVAAGRAGRLQRGVATRLLAVPVVHSDRAHVAADVTRRRIEGLLALGWPLTWISEQLGVDGLRLSDRVTARRARQIADLADQVGDQQGPSAWTRARAARLGYQPPASWDDEGQVA